MSDDKEPLDFISRKARKRVQRNKYEYRIHEILFLCALRSRELSGPRTLRYLLVGIKSTKNHEVHKYHCAFVFTLCALCQRRQLKFIFSTRLEY
jgi:hypothetical protein